MADAGMSGGGSHIEMYHHGMLPECFISIPLWVFMAAIAIPTAILWYRDRRPASCHLTPS